MNEILSNNELVYISGFKSTKSILKWLKRNHIPYLISGNGKPLVHRAALAYVMGVPLDDKPNNQIAIDFSNLEGFK
jgi:hypothetical protein